MDAVYFVQPCFPGGWCSSLFLHALPMPIITRLFRLTSAIGFLCAAAPPCAQGAPTEADLQHQIEQAEQGQERAGPALAASLERLAGFYYAAGRLAEAAPLLERSLAIREQSSGPADPETARVLNNLALIERAQGSLVAAEALLQRSLAIREQVFGPNHPEVAASLNNLALLLQAQGKFAAAEPLLLRSLSIRQLAFGADHLEAGISLNNLALLYRAQGRNAEAEPYFQRSLAICERVFGFDHLAVADSLANLALIDQAAGKYGDAEALFRRSLAIREKVLGDAHPKVAASLEGLAGLYLALHRQREALPLLRRATDLYRQRLAANDPPLDNGAAASVDEALARHLAALWRELPQGDAAALTAEAFELAQWWPPSAEPTVKLAEAQDDEPLAEAVRARRQALLRRAQAESALERAASLPPDRRDAANEEGLRQEAQRSAQAADAASRALAKDFPAYQGLTEPLPLSQAQALLGADQALLLYRTYGDALWAWVVTKGQATFVQLDSSASDLQPIVARAVRRVNLGAAGHVAAGGGGTGGDDLAALHVLYRLTWAPLARRLASVRQVLVVADGALRDFPFAMLVPHLPTVATRRPDGRHIAGLAEKYTFFALPSVPALRQLRPPAPLCADGGALPQGGQAEQRRRPERAGRDVCAGYRRR